ncbi:PREDICTED: uncharacterized protein LOC108359539 [Rhagoletis zephyria]|uniref:uncharacterized protein LOC108359539 n=1 Tax=Rhagoletis zephyria TaxID=28612 RepID=UPI00081182C9|nr:PREDICTED: uncharacterized protein LOC108359539 [Rhagoletis zephyria]
MSDIEYLESYTKLMEPIASAIDFLQADQHMYFGYFIAALISLKIKLTKFQESFEIRELGSVCSELVDCLHKRFQKFFEGDEEANLAIIAAMSCPAVKLRFLSVLQRTAPHLTVDVLKNLFIEHAAQFIPKSTNLAIQTTKTLEPSDSFLEFEDASSKIMLLRCKLISTLPLIVGVPETTEQEEIRRQLETYLVDPNTSLNCLENYKIIREVFLKFNTPIPSSAPVERLFSFAGIVNAPRRKNLLDSNFEKLVLMKANNVQSN